MASTGEDSDATSEAYSTPAFPAFSAGGESSQSSYSLRSSSPVPSVLSMTSSMRAQAFILEYGRGINNSSEVYRLPADDEELDRLHNQHLMLREVLGKYPPVLAEIMVDDIPGETKACLDLGCGSGGWIMEVAMDFPNCSTVAVDLVPLQSITMPPNCRSEVDDINLGLEHFYGDFNVVHGRLIATGIRDYPGLIDHISRVLRPGGLIHLAENVFSVYNRDKQPWGVEKGVVGPPWAACWGNFMRAAVEARGGTTEVASKLLEWVTNQGSFVDIVCHEHFFPLSPWAEGDDPEAIRQRQIGEMAVEDFSALFRSSRPLLLGNGVPPALVDEIEAKAILELTEAKVPHYMKIIEVYAVKRT